MLSAPPPLDLAFDVNDEWTPQQRLYRTASVGSWGVTSIGRGFDWEDENDDRSDKAYGQREKERGVGDDKGDTPRQRWAEPSFIDRPEPADIATLKTPINSHPTKIMRPVTNVTPVVADPIMASTLTAEPSGFYPSTMTSSVPPSPSLSRHPSSRSGSMPRPRRRSSQQRVSLIAGRVSIAPSEPPSPQPVAKSLNRMSSQSSLLSVASSTRAPSPARSESFLGEKTIADFKLDGDIGRGAYGVVSRARPVNPDGSLGSPVVIKKVIKSRILADCWKRHPKHGTIPIEIYVMDSISKTSYTLPAPPPWLRGNTSTWVEGTVVQGHPNICSLLDFFEDNHYYYLVMPSLLQSPLSDEPAAPSDLFDLVEAYPNGLPPDQIRTYLGQIADALMFLHERGIVHRDVKDENVVLGPDGRCILIDFGSSGIVRKNGWDSFSGTLDYAAPEILRGERYHGLPQDTWAFGVVAYVLLIGECPFLTAEEALEGLSLFATASIALDERCDGAGLEGEETDGGGRLDDAATLVRACLQQNAQSRPTFDKVVKCRFLAGRSGLAEI